MPPFNENSTGNPMSKVEKLDDSLAPISSLSGVSFINACVELFGNEYSAIKDEGKDVREYMLNAARKRGFGESLSVEKVQEVVQKYSPKEQIPAMSIPDMEKDFLAERKRNPDFLVASTHPDEVPPEGITFKKEDKQE